MAIVQPAPLSKRRENPFLAAFLPNRVVSPAVMRILVLVQIGIFLLIWVMSPFEVLPRPMEVLHALQTLWREKGLGPQLMNSLGTNVKALGISALLSLGLAYTTVIPFFRPLISALSKGRFLSMVGFTFVFTVMIGGGSALKLALLVFGMTVFFLTSMASVVEEIPRESFDHARTLRMSEPKVVWEVVIRGTLDKAFEVLRQNAAIGWMMVTLVEGNQRSLGGVGAMLLNEQKYLKLDAVFAIQATILILGLFQDFVIGLIRQVVCPYAVMTTERGAAS